MALSRRPRDTSIPGRVLYFLAGAAIVGFPIASVLDLGPVPGLIVIAVAGIVTAAYGDELLYRVADSSRWHALREWFKRY